MADAWSTPLDLDRSVPALLVKIGHYPVHAGGLGAIRSLGRLGVPVYAITEDHLTPAALSRYVVGHFVWTRSEHDEAGYLVDRLRAIGRSLGRPAVAVATDDEAAVLLAEHADALAEHFLLPRPRPDLVRRLASKRGLHELCVAHDVPTPRTEFATCADELVAMARRLTFPLVVKNVDPWIRLWAPAVSGTTIVTSQRELLTRFAASDDMSGLLLQEYIPHNGTDDWFVHSYCDEGSATVVDFVGWKAYAWPPGRGVTADARSRPNPALVELTRRLCKEVGYQGVSDLDWRYDRRDGRFKLVDFNPRVGAQFRFGQTRSGVDVVRALHLSMTGRPVPADGQDYTRRLVVENIYIPSRVVHRLSTMPAVPPVWPEARTYGAWREGGGRDPLPGLAMALRFAGPAAVAAGRGAYRAVRQLLGRMARRGRPATRPALIDGPPVTRRG